MRPSHSLTYTTSISYLLQSPKNRLFHYTFIMQINSILQYLLLHVIDLDVRHSRMKSIIPFFHYVLIQVACACVYVCVFVYVYVCVFVYVYVLAVGDKTRMDQLSKSDDCYVRASPTRGVLGGIAEHTADVITLCEAGTLQHSIS